jgi:hypothetical protein
MGYRTVFNAGPKGFRPWLIALVAAGACSIELASDPVHLPISRGSLVLFLGPAIAIATRVDVVEGEQRFASPKICLGNAAFLNGEIKKCLEALFLLRHKLRCDLLCTKVGFEFRVSQSYEASFFARLNVASARDDFNISVAYEKIVMIVTSFVGRDA